MEMQLFRWVRFVIGYVFISSGILKLLIPDLKVLFINLGIPFPEYTLFLVAIIEIACGTLIIAGRYIQYATIPLIAIMIGALWTTKLPTLLKQDIYSFVFESRLDFVMLILLIVLWRHRKVGDSED